MVSSEIAGSRSSSSISFFQTTSVEADSFKLLAEMAVVGISDILCSFAL